MKSNGRLLFLPAMVFPLTTWLLVFFQLLNISQFANAQTIVRTLYTEDYSGTVDPVLDTNVKTYLSPEILRLSNYNHTHFYHPSTSDHYIHAIMNAAVAQSRDLYLPNGTVGIRHKQAQSFVRAQIAVEEQQWQPAKFTKRENTPSSWNFINTLALTYFKNGFIAVFGEYAYNKAVEKWATWLSLLSDTVVSVIGTAYDHFHLKGGGKLCHATQYSVFDNSTIESWQYYITPLSSKGDCTTQVSEINIKNALIEYLDAIKSRSITAGCVAFTDGSNWHAHIRFKRQSSVFSTTWSDLDCYDGVDSVTITSSLKYNESDISTEFNSSLPLFPQFIVA